jgi:hypothetical protein
MRVMIALLTALGLIIGSAAVPAVAAAADQGFVVALQQQGGGGAPSGKLDVNIDVNRGHGGGAWWANPVWIAIGALAFVLLIVIIAMAFRGGGGTTIIRE